MKSFISNNHFIIDLENWENLSGYLQLDVYLVSRTKLNVQWMHNVYQVSKAVQQLTSSDVIQSMTKKNSIAE